MKETELNKVLNYMKQYVEDKYEHDSEPMLNYKDLQLVLEEIERLHSIIKEVREYMKNTMEVDKEYPDYMTLEICEYQELLDILDKENI